MVGTCLGSHLVMSALHGGVVGTGGFSVYLSHHYYDQKVLVWLGQEQQGETRPGQRLWSQLTGPFTLVSNLWWKREGKKKHKRRHWGGLASGHPEQAR